MLLMLVLLATSTFAQKTIFSQAVGNDTLKIKADMCLWTRGWWQTTTDSLNKRTTDNTFGRAYGFVGVTAQFSKYGYLRYYYDQGEISGKPAYDLYAGLTCCNLDFRFGQLKLPAGYDVITAPWRVDFIDNTLQSQNRTPTGLTRDIGALLTYNHKYFQTVLGLVNGNGRNMTKDNNQYKDVAFRLVASPLGNQNLVVGGNLYWGSDTFTGQDHSRPFKRLAGELLWTQPKYFVRGEFLTGQDSTGKDSTGAATGNREFMAFYAAAGLRVGAIQPVLRYERFTLNDKLTSNLTFGVNYFLFHDMFKPMLDVSLIRDEARKTNSTKVMLQIQAAFW